VPRFRFDLTDWFTSNAEAVERDLKRYFGGDKSDAFTGRWFEEFAAIGDPNRFEPSDVLAVETRHVGRTLDCGDESGGRRVPARTALLLCSPGIDQDW
jgi:hypothetical protein